MCLRCNHFPMTMFVHLSISIHFYCLANRLDLCDQPPTRRPNEVQGIKDCAKHDKYAIIIVLF